MIGRHVSIIIPPGFIDETPVMLERVKKGEPALLDVVTQPR